MKLKIGWKALGTALGNAMKPVLLGAVGGGVIALPAGGSQLVATADASGIVGNAGATSCAPPCTSERSPLDASTFPPGREYVPPCTRARSPYTSELSGV